jgi:hypothetical protein
MRTILAYALALGGLLSAVEGQQAYLAGGVSYFDAEVRRMTKDIGYYAALGYVDRANSGAFGMSSVDLEYRTSVGRGSRVDSFDICYSERAAISQDGVYMGIGVGSWYHRMRDNQAGDSTRRWRPGAKGIIGLDLKRDLFMEVSYHYSGKVSGVSTAGFVAALGVRF